MRLIDADALKREPELLYGLTVAITEIQDVIDEATTVEERKHGHWVRHNNIIACSECIWDMYWEEGNTKLNYCPSCGAKMDGESNE